MHRAVAAAEDSEQIVEGKRIIAALAALKYELQHDRKLE